VTPGQRCPKCGGTQFLIVDPVRDSDCDAISSVHEMHVLVSPASGLRRTGHYRAEVCEGCGFTEWYATRLDPQTVNAILAEPETGARRARS
jgi:predicted nucleic-acid-binding Zn-ribbon protein